MKISVQNVTFSYNGIPAIDEIDLEIGSGEVLGLIGPNGSGKTTLLKTISGLLAPKFGAVYLDSRALAHLKPSEIAQRLSALEQEHHVGFDFTVREIVEWGRTPHRKRLSPWREDDEQAVQEALEITLLQNLSDRSIQSLSGGERQRVFLAMTLAQEPEILLLDEPTAHLDLRFQLEILQLIKRLAARGITIIAAIHDLSLAARISNRVAVLDRGRLVAWGPPEEVLTESLIRNVWGIESQIFKDAEGLWVLPKS